MLKRLLDVFSRHLVRFRKINGVVVRELACQVHLNNHTVEEDMTMHVVAVAKEELFGVVSLEKSYAYL